MDENKRARIQEIKSELEALESEAAEEEFNSVVGEPEWKDLCLKIYDKTMSVSQKDTEQEYSIKAQEVARILDENDFGCFSQQVKSLCEIMIDEKVPTIFNEAELGTIITEVETGRVGLVLRDGIATFHGTQLQNERFRGWTYSLSSEAWKFLTNLYENRLGEQSLSWLETRLQEEE